MSPQSDFWSRRKARVLQEEAAEVKAAENAEMAKQEAALAEKTDQELLAELNLPDPDSMSAGDDFSAFMSKAVPARLRQRALRRLWVSNPVLANLDGLLDYGEDFTNAATVIENLTTTYQVGKGMLSHVEEMERQAALDSNEDASEDTETEHDPEDPVPVSSHEGETAMTDTESDADAPLEIASMPETDVVSDSLETETLMPSRRRMRFEFANQTGGEA